jgi:ABC-type multidrug transport system fused ATPase/permease subunit
LLSLLPKQRRHDLYRLAGLMLLGAAADLLAIGAVVPFLAVLAGQMADAIPTWLFPMTRLSIWAAAALFGGLAVLAGALRLGLAWATQSFAVGAGHDIACEVHRRVLLQPYSYHLQQHSSSTVAALQKVEELVWSVLMPLTDGAVAVVIGGAIVAGLLLIDPLAAGTAIVGVLMLYGVALLATRPALRRSAAVMNHGWDERVRLVGDSLGGIRDIIIDGSQPLFLDLFRGIDARLARARAQVGLLSAAPRFVVEAVGLALIAAAAVVLAERSGGLAAALPVLGALALAAQRLLPLLQQLYRGWAALTASSEVIGSIQRLLTLPLPAVSAAAVPRLAFDHEIRMEQVSFAYPSREQPVLSEINLTITRGSRVAITGRTGSGKSTLADIMMGLLPPTTGQLLVDGGPLEPTDIERWRRNVAHVPQAIFLVDDSLLANIVFGVEPELVDPARAREAARIAQLDDLLAELPNGLDTAIGERGVRLSGGQRQRLGLARAIYRQAPVLVLDEATNALDAATEAAVLHSLDHLQQSGTTIILIAHRPSALSGCDQVLHLSNGRLAPVARLKVQPA